MGKRIGKQYCKWNILFDSCKYNNICIIYFCHNCLPDIKHYWDNSSYSIHCITSCHYYLSRYLCTWHDFKSKLQVFFLWQLYAFLFLTFVIFLVFRMLIIFFTGYCFLWILKFVIGINSDKKEASSQNEYITQCIKKERPRQNEYTIQCIICYSEDREMILKPCNHICVCQNCCKRIIQESNKCPFCQNRIIQRERIYLP